MTQNSFRLNWPTPDDLDLEVYRKNADGSLTKVASSGDAPGEKESAEVAAPVPGNYVLLVISFASVAPTYDLKSTLFDSKVIDSHEVPGLIENWTLTREKRGKVLQTVPVIADRGERAKVNLSVCSRRW